MGLLSPSRESFKFPFLPTGSAFPLSLPNLVIWIDFSNAGTVTVGTGGISQVNDLSGNNNHFSQATTTQRPDYTGTINALNIATFVGVNPDNLLCVNSVAYGPNVTVGSIHKFTGAMAAPAGIYAIDDAGANRIVQHRWETVTAPSTICFPGGTPTTVAGAGAPDISAAAHVFVSVSDNGAHTVNNYIDGTNNGTASGLAALGSGTLATRIGTGATSGAAPWNGGIGELIACNAALSTVQRQGLELYLKQKWGTP